MKQDLLLVSGVLLRALPLPDADRLVALRTMEYPEGLPLGTDASAGALAGNSYPDFLHRRRRNSTFEGAMARRDL